MTGRWEGLTPSLKVMTVKPSGLSQLHDKTEAENSMTRVLCTLLDVESFSKHEERVAFDTSDTILEQSLDLEKPANF